MQGEGETFLKKSFSLPLHPLPLQKTRKKRDNVVNIIPVWVIIIPVGRCLARNPQSSTSLASGNPTRSRRLFLRTVEDASPYNIIRRLAD